MKKFFWILLVLCAPLMALENLEGRLTAEFKIDEKALCPIKNVPLKAHRDWLGVLQFKDGSLVWVSSPKYTFAYLYGESLKNEAGVHAVYLTDHATGRLVQTVNAHYVFGSTLMSVGGDDIIPFADKADAEAFAAKNHGKKIYTIERIDKRFIDYLDMR